LVRLVARGAESAGEAVCEDIQLPRRPLDKGARVCKRVRLLLEQQQQPVMEERPHLVADAGAVDAERGGELLDGWRLRLEQLLHHGTQRALLARSERRHLERHAEQQRLARREPLLPRLLRPLAAQLIKGQPGGRRVKATA